MLGTVPFSNHDRSLLGLKGPVPENQWNRRRQTLHVDARRQDDVGGWPVIQPAVQRVRFRSLCHPGPRLSAPHSFEIVIGTLVDECQYKEYQRFDLPASAAAYRWLLRHESFVRPETSNAIRRLRMKF